MSIVDNVKRVKLYSRYETSIESAIEFATFYNQSVELTK